MNKKINRAKISFNTRFDIFVGIDHLEDEYFMDCLPDTKFCKFPSVVRKEVHKGFDYTTIVYPAWNAIFLIVRKDVMDKFGTDITEEDMKNLLKNMLGDCDPSYDTFLASGNFLGKLTELQNIHMEAHKKCYK